MGKGFNFSDKQLNSLLEMAKKKTGMDVESMKNSIDNGKLDDFVNKNLDAQSAGKIKEFLTDKSKAQQLLSTPEAQELIRKFTEGK